MQKGKIDYIALQCKPLKEKKKYSNKVYNGNCTLRSRSAEHCKAVIAPLGVTTVCAVVDRYSRLFCGVSVNNS